MGNCLSSNTSVAPSVPHSNHNHKRIAILKDVEGSASGDWKDERALLQQRVPKSDEVVVDNWKALTLADQDAYHPQSISKPKKSANNKQQLKLKQRERRHRQRQRKRALHERKHKVDILGSFSGNLVTVKDNDDYDDSDDEDEDDSSVMEGPRPSPSRRTGNRKASSSVLPWRSPRQSHHHHHQPLSVPIHMNRTKSDTTYSVVSGSDDQSDRTSEVPHVRLLGPDHSDDDDDEEQEV